ncbi:hypothetical protein SDC9_209654 [bioreactor metagenome]|uniref:Uncharacterized protein n=1 Tax=bioreactor metagenome TaxID=1076179 RepID=A0A645JDV9_9ZZZZ
MAEPFKLPVGLLQSFRVGLGFIQFLFKRFNFSRLLIGFAKFLLDGLHLLVQKVITLNLFDL